MQRLFLYPVNNDGFSVQVPVLCLTTVLFTAGCVDDSVSESHVPAATHLVMVLGTAILLAVLFRRQVPNTL